MSPLTSCAALTNLILLLFRHIQNTLPILIGFTTPANSIYKQLQGGKKVTFTAWHLGKL